jgi:capsular polysaccharide transport system permease protein
VANVINVSGSGVEPLPQVALGSRSTFRVQLDVIHALILHDIKSRYFGSGLGYIVTILWPSAHLCVIMAIFILGGRVVPNGDSALLYVATGVYPFIVWSYVGRFTMMTALQNKAFLNYPIIRPMDMIIARIILELNTAFIILVWLVLFLVIAGVPVTPNDPIRAALGVLAALTVGIGFGVLGAVFTFILPYFFLAYVVVIIAFYASSGIVINPEMLPQSIADYFYWNPVLHCVEMVRSAYYPDYTTRLLDIRYPFILGFATLSLGLGLERYLRKYF